MTTSKYCEGKTWVNALPEPTSVGRYLIFDEIGVGGMASVHLGLLTGAAGFQRMVAVKRLHSRFAQDPSFCSQFVDEARLAARIRHPNVAQTLDVLWTGNELLLVLEYLDGDTLSQVLKSVHGAQGLVPINVVGGLMSGVLHGLHAAHLARDEQGQLLNVVHRDVSPQNLLIGRDGQVRVLDFGIAKARARGERTEAGVIKGKFGYMAPEQVRCTGVDARTDVYAAGVVLWEMLTCRRLFPQTSQVDQVLRQIASGKITPPSAHRREVSPELDQIVAQATANAPQARFQTAEEFAVALEHSLGIANARQIKTWFEPQASEQLAWRAQRIEAIEKAYGGAESRSAGADLLRAARPQPSGASGHLESTQATRREAPPSPAPERLTSHAFELPSRAPLAPLPMRAPNPSESRGLTVAAPLPEPGRSKTGPAGHQDAVDLDAAQRMRAMEYLRRAIDRRWPSRLVGPKTKLAFAAMATALVIALVTRGRPRLAASVTGGEADLRSPSVYASPAKDIEHGPAPPRPFEGPMPQQALTPRGRPVTTVGLPSTTSTPVVTPQASAPPVGRTGTRGMPPSALLPASASARTGRRTPDLAIRTKR